MNIASTLRRAPKHTRLVIYGAGECGRLIAKDILNHKELNYELFAFVDDDVNLVGEDVLGVSILSRKTAEKFIEEYDEILIAIPSVSAENLRSIADWCLRTDKHYRLIPGYYQLLEKKAFPGSARNVTLEDLLDRQTRSIDTKLLTDSYSGKTILVTGAGGSIGSDLCMQLLQLHPEKLLLLDASEENLFFIDKTMKEAGSTSHIPILGSVCNSRFLNEILSEHRPQCVFHAAAYKHVPMLEANVCIAVLNNVVGTANVLRSSGRYHVEKLVQISTDKAVNPSSIMGATKRICELLVKDSSLEYVAMNVRFGNVLGSSGSLIPIIRDRISKGMPVLITDKRMRRYFMSVSEAASLVLHVGAYGEPGSVYVLDMGRDYSVLEIIKQVIRLEGFLPEHDVEIVETGLRPGEKLRESLSLNPMELESTSHPSINVDRNDPMPWSGFSDWVKDLIAVAETMDDTAARKMISRMISMEVDSSNEK